MITLFLICLLRSILVRCRTYVWLPNYEVLVTTYHYDSSFSCVRYRRSRDTWYVVDHETGNLVRRGSFMEKRRIRLAAEKHLCE